MSFIVHKIYILVWKWFHPHTQITGIKYRTNKNLYWNFRHRH